MNSKNNKRRRIALVLAIAYIMSFVGTVIMSEDATKVAKAAEVTSGVTSDGIIWGGRGTVTETLTTSKKATVTLTESVLSVKVDSTSYPYYDTQLVGSIVIAKDDLLHIFWHSGKEGNYDCMDLWTGNSIKAYKNKSNNKYCLAMNANAYAVKGTSVLNSVNTAIIDKEYFYENHYMTSGGAKKERLITRSEFEKIWNDKDPSEETPEPTVTPSAKPSTEPTITPSVTPSANPTATPICGCMNGGKCTCPDGTCVCVNCPCKDKPCKPTETPTATPNVTTSANPTATPMCGCVNGGPCTCPNGQCVCINCPCKDKLCKPTSASTATATAVTTTSSSSSYQKVKPKVYYTATKVGKRLKLWKVKQWVKDGKIKTSKKWKSICFFDRKKGKIQWNGYKRKTIKTCQFTNKKHWLVGITTKGKLKLYPSGKQTENPKTMKGVYVAIKCNSNGLATAAVKKNGKVVKLKY